MVDGDVDFIKCIRFDGDNNRLFLHCSFDQLIIPNDFLQWERYMLLCLKGDKLLDVIIL